MFPGKRASLGGLPSTLLITAEKDPLRDDGKRLAISLKRSGVRVQHEHFITEAHGFHCSEGPTDPHEKFLTITKNWIDRFSAQ